MENDDRFYGHLRRMVLIDKTIFLEATSEIEDSFSGRADILFSGLHRFFLESSKMIRNALKLFEEGHFDAAFYSVRSALELARIVTYFSDQEKIRESPQYQNWTSGGRFPFDSAIRKELEKSGGAYLEVKEALPDFFIEQDKLLRTIQKYIHKQGYKSFYDRGFTNQEQEARREKEITSTFKQFIKNSLAEIALLRLCIDPFPLLLRDERATHKIHFQSLTSPFNNDFVLKIIGQENVDGYQSTKFYQSHLNHLQGNEELTEATYSLINDQYYNRKDFPEIQQQLHLLSASDLAAVKVFNSSTKISHVYMMDGLLWYFSDVQSHRKSMSFSSEVLTRMRSTEPRINTPYDQAYLSYLPDDNDGEAWIQHNEVLTKEEMSNLQDIFNQWGSASYSARSDQMQFK